MTYDSGGFEKPRDHAAAAPLSTLVQDFEDAERLLAPLFEGLRAIGGRFSSNDFSALEDALERAFQRIQVERDPNELTEEILKACADLRMHVLGVALSGASRKERGDLLMLDVTASEAVSDAPSMGAISHLSGKVIAARICRSMVILLPRAPAPWDGEAVAAGLLQAFNLTPADADWVVDLSGIDELPLSLLVPLAGYGVALKRRGRKLKLVFVKDTVLPESSLAQFIELFQLVKRGPFLFSQTD